jgi:hypothetical protein
MTTRQIISYTNTASHFNRTGPHQWVQPTTDIAISMIFVVVGNNTTWEQLDIQYIIQA